MTEAARGRLAIAAVCLFAWSCTSATSCLEPLPQRFDPAKKTDNAVLVRLAKGGIDFINDDASRDRLIETFFPGGVITVPVKCFKKNVPVVGDLFIANQGSGCSSDPATWDACGRMDKQCDAQDAPVNVTVRVEDLELVPMGPDRLNGRVALAVNTPPIYVDTDGQDCVGLGVVECNVQYDTNRAPDAADKDFLRIAAQIQFSIDTRWDKLLSFRVSQVDGIDICGENGSSDPDCVDTDDLAITSHACAVICEGADLLKGFILGLVSGPIRDQIEKTIDKQSCQPCGAGKPPCPDLPGASSVCDSAAGVCMDSAAGKCVPRFLGIEGRVSPGMLLGGFGVPESSQLDMSVSVGSSVAMDTGVTIGTRAGLVATEVAGCVPVLSPPTPRVVNAPNFDTEASQSAKDAGYHAAVGVSQHFLEMAAFQAHQSGALCLAVSTSNFAMVNTGLFKTLLPSLGKLATRDGKDAPMLVALRPQAAPQLRVGAGTYDPVTKKPIDPLLTLMLPRLQIDFYAMLDDRYARLFSLTADVKLPVSLIIDGCASVTPALGDLKELVSNVKTADSEMLAEDPAVLADLIPAVVGLAEPALAGIIQPIAIPTFSGFKLQLSDVKGVGRMDSEFSHLGLYASIKFEEQACATGAPITEASLVRTQVPPREEMRLTGHGLKSASAVVRVAATGFEGTPGYSWRVNGGMWTDFVPASNDGTLEISHPTFAFEGVHSIEVRSRIEEAPAGISAPASVGFTLDWTPPVVRLARNDAENRIDVEASDAITATNELEFAYRVGQGEFSQFGPARPVDLSAVEAAGGFAVRVRDGAGNIGEGIWRLPTIAERDESQDKGSSSVSAGCTAGPGGPSVIALLALGKLLRRRRR